MVPAHWHRLARLQSACSALRLRRPELLDGCVVGGIFIEALEKPGDEERSVLDGQAKRLAQERLGCVGHGSIVRPDE